MKKLILSLLLLCWVFFVGGVFAGNVIQLEGTTVEAKSLQKTPWLKPIQVENPQPKIQERVEKVSLTKKQLRQAKRMAAKAEKESHNNSDIWINLTPDCLINGGCSFSIYDALDIRKDARADGEETSVMSFVQDIIMALTGFIGTVVTLALIISGIYYLMSPIDSGNRAKAMKGIKYSLIGLVIVMASMVIIRLVQFIAKGGS